MSSYKHIALKTCLYGDIDAGKTSFMWRASNRGLWDPMRVQATLCTMTFLIRDAILPSSSSSSLSPTPSDQKHNNNTNNSNSDVIRCHYQFWDTAGAERFTSISPIFLRKISVLLLFYDITRHDALESIEASKISKIDTARENEPHVVIALVGTKLDLHDQRQISKEEGEAYAKKYSMLHYEVSSKEGTNIDTLFNDISKKVRYTPPSSSSSTSSSSVSLHKDEDDKSSSSSSCC
eukprot:TRINITY_DN3768_c0_g1_i5.p1 TRINITY_DN3768_c0_g1~~TRINITY_DN3768_c0_g1_i5.p1  ORF type:complete len:235 (+),score=51.53 TRINITY_DN3768_c0_g1_i5:501-1205(+)